VREVTVDRIKRIVKKTPVVREIARAAMRRLAANSGGNFSSADYWENRYRTGRNSGAGSYNRLADFKADTLNSFVERNSIQTVIEFGSGDGSQLRLAHYPNYIGVDVSRTAIEATRILYADDLTKRFIHSNELSAGMSAELVLSLDVIYHLVENEVFESYMARLFDSAERFVIVYSSNEERSSDSVHVRHRRFTDWVFENRPDFTQVDFLENPYPEDTRDQDNTSFADFYVFERIPDASQA
jgi:hypothetical protein